MNIISIFHAAAIIIALALGIVVYRTNTRRSANIVFFLLSIYLTVWLTSLALSFASPNIAFVTFCIRMCHSAAAFFPLAFDWLRVGIVSPDTHWRLIIKRQPVWLAISIAVAALSQTPLIVESAFFPTATPSQPLSHPIPEPVYGPAFFVFAAFYILSLGTLVFRFYYAVRRHTGVRRAELQFIQLGSAVSILVAFAVIILLPILTGTSQTTQYAPFAVLALYAVIAYGIATRRIMDVAYVFRLFTAYALLTTYLVALYSFTWWASKSLLAVVHVSLPFIPPLVAALCTAYALAPSHGRMQQFSNRLFLNIVPLDIGATANRVSRLIHSISTVDNLLHDFAAILTTTLGADRFVILLASGDAFEQRYPPPESENGLRLLRNSALARILTGTHDTVVPDVVRRLNPDALLAAACDEIERGGMAVAVGLHSAQQHEGIVLIGPRLSGRIYGTPEQQLLRVVANQLAIALNNANLYTEVQNAKIYNDLLVDNLASGVIAADVKGTLTVANREALRIVKRATRPTVLPALPPPLATVLSDTLNNNLEARNQDIVLQWPDDTETPVRVSSSRFYDHAGHAIGAFLVMSDLTAIRQLELQVRRTDRLASIGTLAAGMAHEIKNPLVSIKTFTQLLPERYEDPDFRETFTSLVGSEVKRIDTIVNQLLRFSRPAKPVLVPTHLHEVLTHTTRLLNQQLRQKDVRLQQDFLASRDLINADAHQLGQALVNLFLNAIEAMEKGGELTLTTSIPSADERQLFAWNHAGNAHHIVLTIQDTGGGIDPESLPHIFDPFFTTKSQGTGLGLSVAHGIITEHNGMIDVKSEKGVGTTFTITFQLLAEEVNPS